MIIKIKRFGKILTSRPAGRDAALSTKAYLHLKPNEKIKLDFTGILSMGPSWLDEFLDILKNEYGSSRIICLPTDNSSVIKSLEVIR